MTRRTGGATAMMGVDRGAPRGGSFPELMAQVQAGDEGAAREVHDRWSRRLVRLARARLGRSIAGKEDAEDVVQSVYRSFFRRFGEGDYRVDDWPDVWALLATIATRKCSSRRKRYQAIRRDSRRETPLADCEVPAPQATAEEAAMLSEAVDRLLGAFEEPDRSIVRLSLQGYSAAEIAPVVARSERTVQRVREHVRSILRRWDRRDAARASA